MKNAVHAAALGALACICLASAPARAIEANDYIRSAVVEEGEREIDFKAGTVRNRDGTRESAEAVGLGLGVNSRWFTEFYAKWHKEPGQRQDFDAWEWENRLQLTETGKYPIDVGFLLEVERPKDRSEGYEYRWGPLLQWDIGPQYTANLNFLVEKHVRAPDADPAELGYQWQLRYRWRPAFEFGVQGFGDVGPVNHLASSSEQSHVAGPMAYGALRVGPKQVIRYNAGLLFGLSSGSPRNQLRLQAEYEF
jgi:hypothetical protein